MKFETLSPKIVMDNPRFSISALLSSNLKEEVLESKSIFSASWWEPFQDLAGHFGALVAIVDF